MTFHATLAALLILGSVMPSRCEQTPSLKERYAEKGVSEREWQMVLDARMRPEKIDEILAAGASITEYFEYPWLEAGYTEQQWLRLRGEGLGLRQGVGSNNDGGEEWAVIHNFLLPGLHQFKRRQYARAWPMTGMAILGAGSLGYGILARNGHAVAASIALWFPAALWSSIDIGVQLHREHNPEAQRFTRGIEATNYTVSLRMPIARR